MGDRLFVTNRPFQTAAVLFHLEGTLARADERPLQEALSRADQAPGTDGRRGLRDARRVLAALERREQAAASRWKLHPAAADLFAYIRANGLAPAVFSRHGRKAVDRFLQRGGRTARHGVKGSGYETATRPEDTRISQEPHG